MTPARETELARNLEEARAMLDDDADDPDAQLRLARLAYQEMHHLLSDLAALRDIVDRARTIIDEACGLQVGTDEERLTVLERRLAALRARNARLERELEVRAQAQRAAEDKARREVDAAEAERNRAQASEDRARAALRDLEDDHG